LGRECAAIIHYDCWVSDGPARQKRGGRDRDVAMVVVVVVVQAQEWI